MTRVIRTIEELTASVGTELGVSDWVEITQDMIDRFADLTGDRQWIHVERQRAAAESPFATTIAHGFLTVSLLTRMVSSVVHVDIGTHLTVNYGFNRLRFTAPVPAGSLVRARVSVNQVKRLDHATEVAWGVVVEIENQPKPAIAAEWLVRIM